MKPKVLRSTLLQRGIPVPHVFSLRDTSLPGFGNASFLSGERAEVLQFRKNILRESGLSIDRLTLAFQEHGAQVLRVETEQAGRGSMNHDECLGPADGLMTASPGVAVGVLVADCCCLLMADLNGSAVGAIHAGWRGTQSGIAMNAVRSFQAEFGVPAPSVRAWISPSISAKKYRVGEEVWNLIRDRWGEGDYLLRDPLRIDLPSLNREQMLRSGMIAENIEVSGICTFDSMDCFSHRRGDSPQGRMLGVISPANGLPS
ncbi:MAG: polyphenol oxidase family protein [Candidatus Omnitrophica bacterium]|nr:polyphenol oxidase family protein [Candidatus Omnitrophota bacterium]MCK6497221.1 polyphenol oxidase family protein [bacterium]MCL4734897.1 polyphenol oxidase family protein [Candidatus Omnitrophota bacterium]